MVRTRVAPSPTGFPHLGLVYQALFDTVLSRAHGGKFLLRIEDTDRTRFVEGAENVIYDTLAWVGMMPDEGPREGGPVAPYRQSERLPLYQKYAQQLIDGGHAYRCFCTKERLETMRQEQEKNHQAPRYDRLCRALSDDEVKKNLADGLSYTIRMKMPDHEAVVVHDPIVGAVTFQSDELDDQVLLKSDGYPTYHLAVVVDDHEMQITHAVRGTEWLPSAPKHVLLYKYFGWDMPVYAHIPILLNSDGKGKLSKRHAHTSVMFYKENGFLPEAVVNYLANIVWNHPQGIEIFPVMDFAHALKLDPLKFDIKSNGVRFDLDKLTWMNGEYIRMLTGEQLLEKLQAFYVNDADMQKFFKEYEAILFEIIALAQTRMKTLKDFKDLVTPAEATFTEAEKGLAKALSDKFEALSDWSKESILSAIRELISEQKIKGAVVYKLMTGREQGLPLPEVLALLKKEDALERLHSITQ